MERSDDMFQNYSKTVQVTVVLLYNGTFSSGGTKLDPALEILEIVLLVIVFLLSFGANLFLLVTISSSYTLRKVPFNMLFVNMCAVFLLESLWNMIVAIIYVSMDYAWKLGLIGCALSSFMVQFVTLEITFSITLMCVEAMLSVCKPFLFQSYLTIKKQFVAIVTMWTVGIILCVPLLLKSMTPKVFPSRYNCGSAGNDGFAHALFLTSWCYSLMIVIGFGSVLNVGIRRCKDYTKQKKKNATNYSNVFVQGDLWTEWVNFKLVAWLSLFYLLFEFPYITIHQASALRIYPAESDGLNSTLTSPTIESYSPTYEKVFTWLRYIYSCLFAMLVFEMRKDIRGKFKALFTCCNKNVVRDNSAGLIVRQDDKKTLNNNKKDSLVPLSLNTPVLYASPNGSFSTNGSPSIESESNSGRRLSKESEVTLPDIGSGSSDNRLSDIPMNDISVTVPEPETTPPPRSKKSVRFSDTVTVFDAMSRRTITPEWVVTSKKSAILSARRFFKNPTRIPTRIPSRIPIIRRTNSITPWRKEFNSTYGVTNPVIEPRDWKQMVTESKLDTGMRVNSLSKIFLNTRYKIRSVSSLSPPQWKIKKFPDYYL